MITTSTFLVGFGGFNLLIALFHRPLSRVIVAFFEISRISSTSSRKGEREKSPGLDRAFDDRLLAVDRPKAARFLLLAGTVNFLGCVALYALFPTMGSSSTSGPPTSHSPPQKAQQEAPTDDDKRSN